jgi:PAS domain S-box-containing protein
MNFLNSNISKIILVLGLIFSSIVFKLTFDNHEDSWKKEFTNQVQKNLLTLEAKLELNEGILLNILSFYTASNEVNREEFKTFVSTILIRNKFLQALEWIPRVTRDNRDQFEKRAKKEGFADFQFTELEKQGSMVPAGARLEYFPVLFVEPFIGNEQALGFDLASNPVRLKTLKEARDSGKILATNKIMLVQEKESQSGILIFAPVYDKKKIPDTIDERRKKLKGFILGVYRLEDMFKKIITPFLEEGVNFVVYEGNEISGNKKLFGNYKIDSLIEIKKEIHFSGQKWTVFFQGDADFRFGVQKFLPLAISGAVLLFFIFISVISEIFNKRTRKIKSEVKLQTKNLQESNAKRKKTNQLLAAISQAQSLFITDADPLILFESLLKDSLNLTQSEYGFIGEVLYTPENKPYLKTYSITNIAWNKETMEFYENNVSLGLEFHNLDTLFGEVITTEESVISNDPANDHRRGGLPKGHPPLTAFLGCPIYQMDKMVGMIGLANRPRGYDESVKAFIEPVLSACANTMKAVQNQKMREQAEKALQDNMARSRAVLEHVVDGIITIDEMGAIDSFNPAAVHLFGYEPLEVKGKNVKMLMPEPYSSEHDQYIQNYLKSGVSKIIGIGREVLGLRKDGSTFPLELGISELYVGEKRMFTGIVRDITERKNAEQKTLEVAQEKSSFASMVSHELRTPLAPISEVIALLSEEGFGVLNDDQKEMIEIMERNIKRLSKLINQVLDFQKLEYQPIQLELELTSLNDIVSNTVRAFEKQAETKNLKIKLILDPSVPNFLLDQDKIIQIISNFLSNAIKFTEKGIISIKTENCGDRVKLSVIDDGIGIETKDLPKLFQPFYQLSNIQLGKPKGTGLGLAISKRLIEKHHGEIGIESQPNIGSTFYFYLPFNVKLMSHNGVVKNNEVNTDC